MAKRWKSGTTRLKVTTRCAADQAQMLFAQGTHLSRSEVLRNGRMDLLIAVLSPLSAFATTSHTCMKGVPISTQCRRQGRFPTSVLEDSQTRIHPNRWL
eukprot:1000910-Pyramimonas_sp.AAC.1